MFNLFSPARRAPGECILKIDGAEIADLYPFLIEVSVDASRAAATEAVLKLETRRDTDGSWIVQDDPRIRPWRALAIEAAFGEEVEEVTRGYIREVQVDFPEDSGGATVTVTVQDDSLKLDREHKRRSWGADTPTTDGQIAASIIGEASLALDGTPATGQSGLVLNQDATDAAFLKERAEANGFELIYREGKVYFGPRQLEASAQARIMVYAGPDTNAISFNVSDDGHKPDRATFDIAPAEGAETESETLSPNLPLLGTAPATSVEALDDGFVWRISREGNATGDAARVLAQEKANEMSFKVKATGALDGARYGHVLKVGLPVEVDGVGTRHSGTWYVDVVHHRFDLSGYRQEFELLRNAYGENLSDSVNPLAGVI
jgi:phage protein D